MEELKTDMEPGYLLSFRDPIDLDDVPYYLWWNAKNNRFFKQEREGEKVKWIKIEEIKDEKIS